MLVNGCCLLKKCKAFLTAKLSFVFHGFLCMKKQCGLRGRLIGQGYMSGIKGCGSSGSLNAARGVGKLLEISGR